MLMRLLRIYGALFRAVIEAFRTARVSALLLICLLIGLSQALVFTWVEGWRFLDAFYFSIVSMATVGYGDLAPVTPLGKLFALAFLLIGIGVFVLTVSSIAQIILHELLAAERHHLRPPSDARLDANHTPEPLRPGEGRKGR
jgi:voltage-gated potassium channel